MKRHGHTIFEVVQQVVRNFFNEEGEETKKGVSAIDARTGLVE